MSENQQQTQDPAVEPEQQPLRVRIELNPGKLPKLICAEGDRIVKELALNPAGFNSVIELDLMRRPHSLKVGAMHNWVELDGELFRFDDGGNGAAALEQALNERYVAEDPAARIENVAVFPNPASPTGFDLQFPACPHGFTENRRRHLKEETVQILQDPEKCRVLRTGMIVVLAPPHLVFKWRHSDMSESHLTPGRANTVTVPDEQGRIKIIDLSRPVDLSNLTANELAAVFNHPAVNRRAALAAKAAGRVDPRGQNDQRAAA